ncbi:FxLD family lanthipeptide [Streptomyces carpaticus]|uniref:FxLD family lanthipeptide n=1 Tax=Streptomyces carpaticus TaxID=285558 RepID=UPI0021FB80CE|nr:FxLD family lanthipeptide [Streptomyces carpaticus]
MDSVIPDTAGAVFPDFDLDVSLVESTPVVAELMESTSDNCGGTADSAGVTCP